MNEHFKALMLEIDTTSELADLQKWRLCLATATAITRNKIDSVSFRQAGEIQKALKKEEVIDDLCNELPKELRW